MEAWRPKMSTRDGTDAAYGVTAEERLQLLLEEQNELTRKQLELKQKEIEQDRRLADELERLNDNLEDSEEAVAR